MTIKHKVLLLALPVTVIALGCTPNDINVGASVRHNNIAQIVEPDPKYEEDQKTEGSVVAGAQQRYRTDRVKKPKTIRTTEGGAGGGRGGSSGGN